MASDRLHARQSAQPFTKPCRNCASIAGSVPAFRLVLENRFLVCMPVFTVCACRRLRASKPAASNSIKEMAICATASPLRNRDWLIARPKVEPSSFNAEIRSGRDACNAGRKTGGDAGDKRSEQGKPEDAIVRLEIDDERFAHKSRDRRPRHHNRVENA